MTDRELQWLVHVLHGTLFCYLMRRLSPPRATDNFSLIISAIKEGKSPLVKTSWQVDYHQTPDQIRSDHSPPGLPYHRTVTVSLFLPMLHNDNQDGRHVFTAPPCEAETPVLQVTMILLSKEVIILNYIYHQ